MIGLHRHSHYSKRDGIGKIADIVRRTGELGQKAWALTDHGTTTGLIEGYLETQKYNEENGTEIKFIFGCEGYWIPSYDIKERTLSRHIILLAKNEEGYRNLLKLVTVGYGNKGKEPDNYYYTMRLTTEEIEKHKEGLIVTSACRGGILKDRARAEERVKRYKEIFGEDFYLEIQTVTDAEQREYNEYVMRLSKETGVKVIVTEDAHYVKKEDAGVHRKWLEADGKAGYYETDDYYVHSEEEVRQALSYIPEIEELIRNTEEVGEKCEQVKLKFGEKNYPLGERGGRKEIAERVKENANKKIKGEKEEYRSRYAKEIKILEECDYIEYMLINEELIRWCRSKGINVGRGRGSVCGSLVAYLLDITRVDPLKFGLYFERFANPERITPPDIDIDVPNSRRKEVIEHLKEKYGEVYHVRTIGTTAEKTAIQRAARALGYSAAKIKEECTGKSLKEVEERVKELAEKFKGLIQQYGIHASALIIFPSEAEKYCAIERQGGEYVCGYRFEELEKQGLLKMDILGMKTLDTLTYALELIKENRGEEIDIDELKYEDGKTIEMLREGDTLGCFQLESIGMKKLVKELQPKSLYELIPLIALYRPSSIQSGVVEEYVKRSKAKTKKIESLPASLEEILKETKGVLLYQEQAMKIVQKVAGYSLAKADVFRRAIGHKDNEKMKELIEQFVRDGKSMGYEEKTMLKLSEWLRNCASYQFNKSHSAAYGLLSYQSAYLKANYPAEYIASYLNAHSDEKQEELIAYVEYAKRKGIKILPPNASVETTKWKVEGEAIRVGVSFIKGVGEIKVPLDKETLKRLPKNKILNLIKAGALSYLGERETLAEEYLREEYEKRYGRVKKKVEKIKNRQPSLLIIEEEEEKQRELEEELEAIAKEYKGMLKDKRKDEEEVMGIGISSAFGKEEAEKYDEPDPKSDELKIAVTIVRGIRSYEKNKREGAILTIETPTGRYYEVNMSGAVYEPLRVGGKYTLTLKKNKVMRVLEKWKS